MKLRASGIVVVAAVAAALAGCTFVTPIATHNEYDASDGINVTVGDVKLLNALVITDDGTDGNLVAQAYNDSGDQVDLTLQYDVDGKRTVSVTLPADGATDIGYGAKGQTYLPAIGTKPGGLLSLYVQYGDEPGKQVQVPVLDNALHPYASLTPTPIPTITPTPTATVPEVTSPQPTASPTPSATAK